MLFIISRPQEAQDKLGLPVYIEQTYTEEFNEKKPTEPLNTVKWRRYNRHKDGVPVPKQFQLPKKMFMIIKGIKRFELDFFSDKPNEWIVSAQFLLFLKKYQFLGGRYEECELIVVSTGKRPLTDKKYYLLRLLGNDNALVDFEKTPKIISPVKPFTKYTPSYVYYPELKFYDGMQLPSLFFLDDRSYWYSFFCNAEIKDQIEQEKFIGMEVYSLEKYIEVQIETEKKFL